MSREEDPPFEIAGLDHLVLRTADTPRLIAFYESLGCKRVRVVEELGLYQLQAGRSLIDIVDVNAALGKAGGEAPGKTGRNLDHFALRIDPFDPPALKAFAEALGAELQEMSAPLFGAEGYGPSVYLRDPDGNTVELKGPADEDQTPPF